MLSRIYQKLPESSIEFRVVYPSLARTGSHWWALVIFFGMALLPGLSWGEERLFTVKGKILKLEAEHQRAIIDHEPIPGFMQAMTMPFALESPEALEQLRPGDIVIFEYVVETDRSYARDFRVIERAGMQAATPAQSTGEGLRNLRLEADDPVPDLTLINQDQEPVQLYAPGKYTFMTFIFTRCPVPDFCPRMMKHLKTIAALAESKAIGEEQLRFLGITLDPEFDTPEVLKQYGEDFGVSFDRWDLARLSLKELELLTDAFRVYRKFNGVTLDHTLVTALISPEGKILSLWRGNRWEPEEAFQDYASRF